MPLPAACAKFQMTFLPIVDRELRVTARRPSTYRMRIGIALVAVLVFAGSYLAAEVGWLNRARAGKNFFDGLAGFAFVCCLFAGLGTTADSICREKREGTLGFLFLTDLRSYDVILGKCFATSLASFFAVVTICPVLSLSLLFGGITGGEFWRMTLVLLSTFLFSITAGIWVSTINRDARMAIGGSFAVLLTFALVLPVSSSLMFAQARWHGLALLLSLLSPVNLFLFAADAKFSTQPAFFWSAFASVGICSLSFLTFALWLLPHAWRENSKNNAQPLANRLLNPTRIISTQRKRARENLLAKNPVLWLVARDSQKRVSLWLGIGLSVA
ncbi:MAG: hypothetical protein DME26_06630, partial [Verrucomicrobia bacterium]